MTGDRARTAPIGAVTLRDVAERAGVSSATASRALAGNPRPMDAALRQRVLDAAADLRYVSDGPARALARKQTSLVGLVVHDVDDPYYSAIASGAMEVARDRGLLMMMASAYRDAALQLDYVARLRAQRARAILLAGGLEDARAALAEELEAFTAQGGRVVAIGADDLGVDTVTVPNESGAREVARHLHAAGHRRIGVVAGPPGLQSARQRRHGFLDELSALGVTVPDDHVEPGDFTRAGGRAAALALRRRAPQLTAIFALNDAMAVGVLAALRDDLGLVVPADVSVAGFDDTPVAQDVTPALTTVHLPLIDMGRRAMALALDPAGEGPRRSEVAVHLVERSSTGPVRVPHAAP